MPYATHATKCLHCFTVFLCGDCIPSVCRECSEKGHDNGPAFNCRKCNEEQAERMARAREALAREQAERGWQAVAEAAQRAEDARWTFDASGII